MRTILSILLVASLHAVACDVCAVYNGVQGSGESTNGPFVVLAERYTRSGTLQLNGDQVPNATGQRLDSLTAESIVGYNFTQRFSLQASVPYIYRSFRRINGANIEEGTESGLGDVTFFGKYLLYSKATDDLTFKWNLIGGVKVPTGSTRRLAEETSQVVSTTASTGSTASGPSTGPHGEVSSANSGDTSSLSSVNAIHGHDLTLGSGSFDGVIGTNFFLHYKRAFFSGSAQYYIRSKGDYGYRFANELSFDGGPGFYLLSEPDYTLAIQSVVSGDIKGTDTVGGVAEAASCMRTIYVGERISATWKGRLSADLGLDIPVLNRNSSLQTVPDFRVRAGLTWYFSSLNLFAPDPLALGRDDGKSVISTDPLEPHFYGGVEYLLWWVKGAPLSVPLVSTGPIATTHHGWLINSDATILYGNKFGPAKGGNDTQNFAAFSGSRLTLGCWLDEKERFAIEASGFLLESRNAGFEIRSDNTGLPIINVPVYNTISYSPPGRPGGLPPFEDGLPASLPNDPKRFDGNNGIFSGGVKITNSLQLWGADVTGVINLYRDSTLELSSLFGIRYLDLAEAFNLTYDSTGVTGNYAGQTGVANDTFQTRNQFYGENMGLRGRYSRGPVSVEMTACVALGLSHETENIAGAFNSYNYITPTRSGPEGIFAQPANEGRTTGNKLAVVPEVKLKVGYALTSRLRATIGYDFLYYSNVLRPTDQINRNLPKGQTFQQGGVGVSSTSPSRLNKTTDFFAQGLSVGMEFSF